MIASGEKKEEYREIKSYWLLRLGEGIHKESGFYLSVMNFGPSIIKEMDFKHFDIISANNGYSKGCPNIKWKHEGITIGEGREDWGAEPGKKYFILKIGDLIQS